MDEKNFIDLNLIDSQTSAFKIDCLHIVYPGTRVLCYNNRYFCNEECLMDYLIRHDIVPFTVETVPHIRKSTEKFDA